MSECRCGCVVCCGDIVQRLQRGQLRPSDRFFFPGVADGPVKINMETIRKANGVVGKTDVLESQRESIFAALTRGLVPLSISEIQRWYDSYANLNVRSSLIYRNCGSKDVV